MLRIEGPLFRPILRVGVFFLTSFAIAAGTARAGSVERVSVNSNQQQGDDGSYWMTMSSNGRWIAFSSDATNLVIGDTNAKQDVFLRDQQSGQVIRVSQNLSGAGGDGSSGGPVISDDGSCVVYGSFADNLVGVSTAQLDVYLYDVATMTTELISVGMGSVGNNEKSGSPTLSADGRYVAFFSSASNLVLGDTNGRDDCFLRDRIAGTTTRISLGMGGGETNDDSMLPHVSADGRYVVYTSWASNVVPNDVNAAFDVFRFDTQTGTTDWVSAGGNGFSATNGSGATSSDGRFVCFDSTATNLTANDLNGVQDVFVMDMVLGTTERISETAAGIGGNVGSYSSGISDDGRFVVFSSFAENLVPGDTNNASDIFLHDRQTGKTTRVSEADTGVEGDSGSFGPTIGASGRYVGFFSEAMNLVNADTNNTYDTFVHAQCWAATEAIGAGVPGSGGAVPSLTVDEGTCFEGGYQVCLSDAVGGGVGLLFLGAQIQAQSAFGGTFYVDPTGPFVAAPLLLSGSTGAVGAGSISFGAPDIHAQLGTTWYLQGAVADLGAPAGVALTNAARLSVEQ